MATELSGVRRAIRDPDRRGVGLTVSGIGRTRIRASIRSLAESAPTAIVLLGFCGGADPGLKTGDLHVADCFMAPDPADAIAPDAALAALWSETARDCGVGVASGPSASVEAVANSALRSDLYRSSGVASVNMEDYWAAETARAFGIPFVSVRAVLDHPATDLPAHLPSNPDSVISALANLAAHPEQLPATLRLARLARAARDSLTRCALVGTERMLIARRPLPAVAR